jgi:hypothetical protein
MTNEILRSYFLGELDERAAETVERAVFDRQTIAEQAFAVEAELFEDFNEARLSAAEREKFERNYLVTDARRAQLAVSEFLRREYGAHKSPQTLVAPLTQSFWQKFFGFDGFSKRLAFSGFAILACLIGAVLYVLWTAKTNAPENAVALVNVEQNAGEIPANLPRAASAAQENLNQRLPTAKTNSNENALNPGGNLNSTIEKNKQSPASPKKTTSVEQKPIVTAIASTILVAGGLQRGESSGEQQTVKISPNAKLINLKLILPPEADANNYRAEITTLERETVFAGENIKVSAGKKRQINVQVPTRRLAAPRQYVLFLKDSENSSIAEYFFRVADE